ncbi:MAG: hypothetical protein GX159_07105 [Flavobacteriaceae bacterium]|jgi:hypothetical protein|nr:hypothetical protein [Flavobacteriaceae bacterium]
MNVQSPNSVSLHHLSEARDSKLTVFSSHFIMDVYGDIYRYDLDSAKWVELNEILNKVSVKELADYSAPEVSGRLVERDLKSQISIQTPDGEFVSQEFLNENVPDELRELYNFLNSFFPVL